MSRGPAVWFFSLRTLVVLTAILCAWGVGPVLGADRSPPPAAIAGHPVQRSEPSARPVSGSGGAWWLGPSGVVLILAVLGGASWVARRYKLPPAREAGWLQVLARAPLAPGQTVHAVRVGDRVLILGTGAGGSPTLLADRPVSDLPDLGRGLSAARLGGPR